MGRRSIAKHKGSRPVSTRRERWVLVVDSKEAAVNLYSILLAFQRSGNGGLIDSEGVRYITRWLRVISERVPDVEELAGDVRGPFRPRDLSPIRVSLELDARERDLMLFICRTIYTQLTTPEGQRSWIENQGRTDYEMAVKNFRTWMGSLEER